MKKKKLYMSPVLTVVEMEEGTMLCLSGGPVENLDDLGTEDLQSVSEPTGSSTLWDEEW